MNILPLEKTNDWFGTGIPNANLTAPWQRPNLESDVMYPDESKKIKYKLNDKGYRDVNWSDEDLNNSVWCIGHSDVFGIGVNADQTWPSLLSSHLKTINLGIAGAAWDTISRLIYSGLQSYKPKYIIIQSTTLERREFISDNIQQVILPNLPDNMQPDIKFWKYIDQASNTYTVEKNLALIESACKAAGVEYFIFDLPNRWDLIAVDPATDNQHIGPSTHRLIAQQLICQLPLK